MRPLLRFFSVFAMLSAILMIPGASMTNAGATEDLFQVPFRVYPVVNGPRAAASGFFDDDGKADVLVAGLQGRGLSLLFGDGQGRLLNRKDFPLGLSVIDMAVADVTGDGRPDAVVVGYGSKGHQLLVQRGTEAPGFEEYWNTSLNAELVDVAVGDVNADGQADLVALGGSSVFVFRADGLGGFEGRTYGLPGQGTELVLSDLTGDGRDEIVVAVGLAGRFVPGVASIWHNAGDGTFVTRRDYTALRAPSSLVVADMDADGIKDIVVAFRIDRKVGILYGRPDGTFGDRKDLPVRGWVRKVRAVELVEGGGLDLITTQDEGNWFIFPNLGSRQFGASRTSSGVIDPQNLAFDDFNADGHIDVVAAGGNANAVSISLGNGDGTFGYCLTLRTGLAPNQMVFGNFDGKGRDDLAVVNNLGLSVSVLLADEERVFAPAVDYPLNGLYPRSIDAADLNGDNIQDLAVVSLSTQKIHSFLGMGDGTFTPEAVTEIVGNPFSISLRDLNGDSFAEAVVTSSAADRISVYRGYGDGTFGPPIATGFGATIKGAVLTTVDLNDNPDLVQASDGVSNAILIMRGNGGGTFLPSERYETALYPHSISVGRVDMDIYPDLAIPCDDVITIYCGNSKGGFQTRRDIPSGRNPHKVAIADVTLDGSPDLVVTYPSRSAFSVLANDGFGGYVSLGEYGTCGAATDLKVRDVDADGRPDVLISGGGGVIVYRNEGRLTTKLPVPRAPLVEVELVAEPNPSSGPVTLNVTTTAQESVRLEVFDAQGRRVAVPWDGILDAGRHEIAWDGTAVSGAATSGMYWVRMSTRTKSVVEKIIRVR